MWRGRETLAPHQLRDFRQGAIPDDGSPPAVASKLLDASVHKIVGVHHEGDTCDQFALRAHRTINGDPHKRIRAMELYRERYRFQVEETIKGLRDFSGTFLG